MKKMLALIIFSLFILSPLHARETPTTQITPKEAAQLIKNEDVIIVDVRTPGEFEQGHLPNARNIDFFGGRFDYEITQLPKDKTILLYCRTGKRSAGALEALKEAGYEKVLDMKDGILSWQKAGLSMEKSN